MLHAGPTGSGFRIEPFRTISGLSPLLYYRMSDSSTSITDWGSGGRTGTATNTTNGTALTTVATKAATPWTAKVFNGTTAYITSAFGTPISGTTPQFSAGVLFNCAATSASEQKIFHMLDATSSGSGFSFSINTTTEQFTVKGVGNDGLNDFALTSSRPYFIPTSWVGNTIFFGISVTATEYQLYFNGICTHILSRTTGKTWATTAAINIGRNHDATLFFNGTISDAFVTSTVLTRQQWRDLYYNSMALPASPLGDNWNEALNVPLGSQIVFSSANSRMGVGEPGDTGDVNYAGSMWAKFVAPETRSYAVSVSGTVSASTETFTGSSLAALTTKTGTGEVVPGGKVYSLTAGQTMYIRVRTALTGTFTVKAYIPPAAPGNDNFADAQLIDVSSPGTVNGTNLMATKESGEPEPTGNTNNNTTWFKFTAPATGNITIDTELSPTIGANNTIPDMTIGVYTGTNVASLTLVAADDDSGIGAASKLTAAITNGTVYYILVKDYENGVTYTLRWSSIV